MVVSRCSSVVSQIDDLCRSTYSIGIVHPSLESQGAYPKASPVENVRDNITLVDCNNKTQSAPRDLEDAHYDSPTSMEVEVNTPKTNSKNELLFKDRVAFPLIANILIGDLFHNFADGILIGVSFRLCSTSVAWTVALSTITHEVAQELSDFFILTGPGKMSTAEALSANCAIGMTCVLGAMISVFVDVSNATLGSLLSFGASCYIFVAAVELLPWMLEQKKRREQITGFLSFVVGAVAVGLVLLDHQHCDAGGHGHNH